MAALGGVQDLPFDETLYGAPRSSFYSAPLTVEDWSVGYGEYGTTWHDENSGGGVPDVDNPYQKWPRWY